MELIPIVGVISSSVTVVLVVYFVAQARTRRVEARMQMQSKLIDRFGSAPELVEFLQSPAGRSFVTGVQAAPALLMRERLLHGFTRAIVLISLGLGFLGLTYYVGRFFAIPAVLLFSLGVGFLLATFVSYKLSGGMHVSELDADLTQP
ncbi:MAG TPA: hypothetical protein VEK57_01335 [Thermoanaerobaculia bacterium]|nr:hypothetical protein [Thermoanaerobaculia bacterium]